MQRQTHEPGETTSPVPVPRARRILLAVQDRGSLAAANVVADLAAALDRPAEVEVLYVQEVVYEHPLGPATDPSADAIGFARTTAAALRERGVVAHDEVRAAACERVADDILAEAADTNADLIVVGCRARSGLASWLFGSTAHHLIRRADRPVLVVRNAMTVEAGMDGRALGGVRLPDRRLTV